MTIYLSVAVGIAISVILPLIRAFLPKPPKRMVEGLKWLTIRPYVATGVFSLIVALLIVAFIGEQLDTPAKALIAGYTWDSTLQKFTTGNVSSEGQFRIESTPTPIKVVYNPSGAPDLASAFVAAVSKPKQIN